MNSIYIFAFTLAGIGLILSAVGFGLILKELSFVWEMNRMVRKAEKEER